jgi:hypothetical protein
MALHEVYENVVSTYTEGPFYCIVFVRDEKRITHKFPITSLFRVVEDYEGSKR